MRKRSVLVALGMLAATFPVLGPDPADAATNWNLAAQVTDERNPVDDFDLDVAPNGAAVMAWETVKNVPDSAGYLYGSTSYVRASYRSAGSTSWSIPQTISETREDAHLPDVAIDAEGNAVVVWGTNYVTDSINQDDPDAAYEQQVRASYKDADSTTFNSPETITPTHGYYFGQGSSTPEPAVVFDSAGNAVAVWDANDPDTFESEIETATLSASNPGFGFGSTNELDSCFSASNSRVAADGGGHVLAMWSCMDDESRSTVAYAERAGMNASFGGVTNISLGDGYVFGLDLAMNGPSDAAAAWSEGGFETGAIKAIYRTGGGAFSSPSTLKSLQGEFGFDVDAAVASTGAASVAWSALTQTEIRSDIVDREPGVASGWVASSLPQAAVTARIEFAEDDTLFVAFGRESNTNTSAAERPWGGAWGTTHTLDAGDSGLPLIDTGGRSGNPTVAWYKGFDGDRLAAVSGVYNTGPEGKIPVIFLPGIMGSEIVCKGSDVLWPDSFFKDNDLLEARLASDGISPFDPSNKCNSSARPRDVIMNILTLDVYGSAWAFLSGIEETQVYMQSFDWRKNPRSSVGRLNTTVDRALAETGAEEVILIGHSMGGLVIEAYMKDALRAAKVGRVATLGTPYWGSLKPFRTLLFGEEDSLEVLYERSTIKQVARNLTGMYFLLPTRNYAATAGDWLTWVHGNSTPTLEKAVELVFSDNRRNVTLYRRAMNQHESLLDGFVTHGVPWSVVVGTGVETVVHHDLTKTRSNPDQLIEGNGDGTVPLVSELQGLPGERPMGDDVTVHGTCGIDHSHLSSSSEVWVGLGFEAWIVSGTPLATGQACAEDGTTPISLAWN